MQRTPDGRYIHVKGRRWRAADPHIHEKLAAELASASFTGGPVREGRSFLTVYRFRRHARLSIGRRR